MVHLHKNRFPAGTYCNLQNRKYGPCHILKKISDNAYVVELPKNMFISPTFNIADLFEYHPPDQQFDEGTTSETSFFLNCGKLMQDVHGNCTHDPKVDLNS